MNYKLLSLQQPEPLLLVRSKIVILKLARRKRLENQKQLSSKQPELKADRIETAEETSFPAMVYSRTKLPEQRTTALAMMLWSITYRYYRRSGTGIPAVDLENEVKQDILPHE